MLILKPLLLNMPLKNDLKISKCITSASFSNTVKLEYYLQKQNDKIIIQKEVYKIFNNNFDFLISE